MKTMKFVTDHSYFSSAQLKLIVIFSFFFSVPHRNWHYFIHMQWNDFNKQSCCWQINNLSVLTILFINHFIENYHVWPSLSFSIMVCIKLMRHFMILSNKKICEWRVLIVDTKIIFTFRTFLLKPILWSPVFNVLIKQTVFVALILKVLAISWHTIQYNVEYKLLHSLTKALNNFVILLCNMMNLTDHNEVCLHNFHSSGCVLMLGNDFFLILW